MIAALPDTIQPFMTWSWADIEPYYQDLESQKLDDSSVDRFLRDWSDLTARLHETQFRLHTATDQNTADEDTRRRFTAFMDDIYPQYQACEQRLREKFLASGLQPAGFEVPLKRMRAQAELFRESNVPLLAEDQKLGTEYFKITGAQTVEWEGKTIPVSQLLPVFERSDRALRERAWRLGSARALEDRNAINSLWQEELRVRQTLAANAGLPDYRAYRWRQLLRFDYSVEDCEHFHDAVATVITPLAVRLWERRRKQWGVETIRPWDIYADPLGRPPLHPYNGEAQLVEGTRCIFERVDPVFAGYLDLMHRENMLDLDSRANKSPSGYNIVFLASKLPFIFMNAVGSHRDVQTLLHEGGHAFHGLELSGLPYLQQRMGVPIETAEVASMSMELLSLPYLEQSQGGFYSSEDAQRARRWQLEMMVGVFGSVALVDAFQHWTYTHPDEAADPEAANRVFAEMTARYRPWEDWSGLEEEQAAGWQRILHIHTVPMYFIEYAIAQLGAIQVWANALQDQAEAVRRYRHALSLGNTVGVPEFYHAAGARFAFDEEMLRFAAGLMEQQLDLLEA
ncbi:MAG: M3 family oligoendopeptidase [Chloroflexota bacterium]